MELVENLVELVLGLSICSDIIKKMGSKIEVNSIYEKGSEFSFKLEFETIPKEDSF